MKLRLQSALSLATFALAASACSASHNKLSQTAELNGAVIGKVTGEQSDWQICKAHRCKTPDTPTLQSGNGLKSGVGIMHFDIYAGNNQKSSHKLLGMLDAISVSKDPKVITFTLADGTLSGEVTDQPVRIVFAPGPNSRHKAAYCEFSAGKYEAVNYGLNVFDISGGKADCYDKGGVKHNISSNTFEI